MGIGERIRSARQAAKLTQKQLGEAVGVSQQTIQKMESGHQETTGYAVQIATALGVRPEWLATGEEPMRGNLAEDIVDEAKEVGELASRLRLAFDVTGKSQAAIAAALDVSPQGVGKWLQTGAIARSRIPALCEALDISLVWFLTGTGPMQPYNGTLLDSRGISPEEWEVVEKYRSLDKVNRDHAKAVVDAFVFKATRSKDEHEKNQPDPPGELSRPTRRKYAVMIDVGRDGPGNTKEEPKKNRNG